MINFIGSLYRYIRLFSIDIVLGALAGVFLAENSLQTEVPRHYYTILACVVWVIYLLDHIIDGVRAGKNASNLMQKFFHKHRIPLILVCLMMLIFIFRLVIYRLEPEIIQLGLVLSAAVFFYFLLNVFPGRSGQKFFIREIWISIIYVAGIWGGPVLYANEKLAEGQWLLILSFFLLILSNVFFNSYIYTETNQKEGKASFSVLFGKSLTRSIVVLSNLAGMIVIFLNLIFYSNADFPSIFALMAMQILMFYVVLRVNKMKDPSVLPLYADAILIIPFVLLIG